MDFWLAYEDYLTAFQRDHALQNLERLTLDIIGRGPEGEQVQYDKNGSVVKGEGKVKYTQLEKLIHELQVIAGIAPESGGKKPLTKTQKVFQSLANLARTLGMAKGVTGGSANTGDKPTGTGSGES